MERALRASGSLMALDEALAIPALAICLRNAAAVQAGNKQERPAQAATRWAKKLRRMVGAHDWRRIAANDD